MRQMRAFDPSTLPVAGATNPTQGQGQKVDSGLTEGCGTIYFMNKSNVGINVLFEDGSVAMLPAWFARPLVVKTKSNQIWLSQAYTLTTINNPISMLFQEVYQPGEDTTGMFSGPLPYQQNVGNALVQASQVEQLGQPQPTFVVAATPGPVLLGAAQVVQINNDGSVFFGNTNALAHNNVQWDNAGDLIAATLTSERAFSSDGALITSDNAGNLTLILLKAQAQPTLLTGYQERGVAGAGMQGLAGGTNNIAVNFKTRMTNVPSSITLTPTVTNNITGSATAANITIDGFLLTWISTAAGFTRWFGTYETVGN